MSVSKAQRKRRSLSPERMHDGKVVYRRWFDAKIGADRLSKMHGYEFSSYPCAHGDTGQHWHVGSPRDGEARPKSLNDGPSDLPREAKWL